jgi:hypothetical protein
MPETGGIIVPRIPGTERFDAPGIPGVPAVFNPTVKPDHAVVHFFKHSAVLTVHQIMIPYSAGNGGDGLKLTVNRTRGITDGNRIKSVGTLTVREEFKCIAGRSGSKTGENIRADGAGTFEPAAQVRVTFIQNGFITTRRNSDQISDSLRGGPVGIFSGRILTSK